MKIQRTQKSTSVFLLSLTVLLISCILVTQTASTASAQTSTKSGSIDVRLEGKDIDDGGSATPNPESINKAINERITKQLNQEQEKKLTNMLDSINRLRRAVFGQVEKITDNSLTITTGEGTSIIPIPKSIVVKQGSKTIKSSDIAVENWVLVVGANTNDTSVETSDSSVFLPQQITVFTSNPVVEQPVVELGIVDSLSKTTIQVVSRASGQNTTFSILKTTRFQDSKGKSASFDSFEKDISVLVVGYKAEKSNSATIIRSLASLDQNETN